MFRCNERALMRMVEQATWDRCHNDISFTQNRYWKILKFTYSHTKDSYGLCPKFVKHTRLREIPGELAKKTR